MTGKKLILASASPRRRSLLLQIGLEHTVMVSGCEEKTEKTEPQEIVMELSRQKAQAVFKEYWTETARSEEDTKKEVFFLAADTIVSKDGEILGKPSDRDEAAKMLGLLKNGIHQVYTGVCILCGREGKLLGESVFFDRTDVFVNDFEEAEMEEYLLTGEADDKAGAYGIQGFFARHIQKIDGNYANVAGLPISKVYDKLKEMKYFEM